MQERKSYLVNKAFRKYLWATVLTVAATQIANIIDAAIVGHLVSADGLAAVNLSKPIIQTSFALTCLYVASCAILAGMAIGKGDRKKADQLFTFSIGVSVLLGLLMSVCGLIWFKPLSNILCQSDTLRPLADSFIRVTLFGLVFQMLMQNLHQFVTMDGNPKLVTLSVVVGNIFNILLDIVFIKYCGWGIAGAAAATCIMYAICIIAVLPHFRRKGSLRLCRTRIRDVETGRILSIGLPLFFSTVLLSVQFVGNNYVAGRYMGDNGLVAMAVCVQMFSFSMIFVSGTLRTVQPVGSILKGMEDNSGIRMLLKRSYLFLCACYAIYVIPLVLFPESIGSMLGVSQDSGMETVRQALPVFTLNIVSQGLLCNLLPAFQLYERKGLAFLLSIAQTLLPMLFFLLLRGQWIGFFIGQAVTFLAIVIWSIILRRKNGNLSKLLLIPLKDDRKVMDISLTADTQSMSKAVASLTEILVSNGKDRSTVSAAAVCTEELIHNIIEHGHAAYIDLAATIGASDVCISIHDDGTAFDPAAAISASDSEKGLGLTIAKAFCSEVKYKYIFNQNMVTIRISVWNNYLRKYGTDSNVTSLLFVKCNRDSGNNSVEYYVRGTDDQFTLDSKNDAFIGKNGLGKEREGDGKTPVGNYRATGAFGIKPNPGTALPYLDITSDTYACDEEGPYYNRIADSSVTGHICKGEHMIEVVPAYNLGIVLDYNPDNVYPLGSAIFLHCKGLKNYTAGCVAVDEEFLRHILQTCGTSPVICIGYE